MSGFHIQRTGSPIASIDRTCHPRNDSSDSQRLMCLLLNNLPRSSSDVYSRDQIEITKSLTIPNDWRQAQCYHPRSLDTLSLGMDTVVTRIPLDSDSGEYKYSVMAEISVSDQKGNTIDEIRLGEATHKPWENHTVLQTLTAIRRKAKVLYNWHGERRSDAEQFEVDLELTINYI